LLRFYRDARASGTRATRSYKEGDVIAECKGYWVRNGSLPSVYTDNNGLAWANAETAYLAFAEKSRAAVTAFLRGIADSGGDASLGCCKDVVYDQPVHDQRPRATLHVVATRDIAKGERLVWVSKRIN
jgi:hypothetical protein